MSFPLVISSFLFIYCLTTNKARPPLLLPLKGRLLASKNKTPDDLTDPLSFYGSDEDEIKELIERDKVLGVSLGKEVYITPAQIIFAVRNEMARTVEDVLARRTRILFIDAKIASSLAAKVAEIMMEELNKDEEWRKAQTGSFKTLAKGYLLE